ncbi:hypothetical protein GIB67_039466, partial [Kingdonia uniflora]
MMYCKEYMNDRAKGNYTRGLRTFGDYDDECAKPLDKKGKEYFLNTVEYEQARKWVLRQAAENSEWEEKYNTYKENLNSRSQSQRGNRRTEKLIDYVSWLTEQLKNDEDSSFKKLMEGLKTTRENISPLVGDWRDLEEEDKEYIRKVVAEKGRPKGSVKRRVIEWERVKQAMLNEVQENLEVEANERRQLEKRVAAFESRESPRGAYMHRPFENNVSTSQVVSCSLRREEKLSIPHRCLRFQNKETMEFHPSNKHAIVVATATAAVVKVKVTLAHAVAVAVKLTGGSGRCMKTRVDWAAVRIQAAFRGYLGEKTLWSLKGLVKLQALERGHIVRKKTTDTMRAIPQFYSATSRPGSAKGGGPFTPTKSEYSQSFYSGYSDHPNCMTNTGSSRAKGRRCSPPPPKPSSGNSCILKDMFGTNIAYETMQFNTTTPKGFYSVIIDEVIREEACLYVESRTLGDVSA